MSRTSKPKRSAPDRKQLHIALRLYDWSEWCRQVIRGVQRYAIECKDWRIFVAAGPPGMTRILRDGVVWDGIITGVLQDIRGYQRALKTHNTKVVVISAAVPHALRHLPRAAVDDDKVAASIGRHLLSGGFRHLAYSGAIGSKGSDARWDAMRAFASAANCDLHRYGDFLRKRRSTPPLLAKWIKQLPKPVGITSWNMDEARQVVEACVRQKLNVPEQVAVVAWDDDEIIAETLDPTISAAVLPAERLGFESARLLHELLKGKPELKEQRLVEPSGVLRIRQSSDVSTLRDRDVHLADQYIREHGLEFIRIDKIARELRVSRRKLEQDYVRVTGRTLHDAIVLVRLEQARILLAETDWPTERIAIGCGLSTAQSLHRMFLQYEKQTPGQYRKSFRTRPNATIANGA